MKDFVTSQITKKLKEKGYPLLKVIKQNGNPFVYDLPKEHPDWQNCDAWYIPTIWQVLKWLREEKKIHVNVDIMRPYPESQITNWGYNIVLIDKYEVYHFNWNLDSYDESVLDGIEYVLDNLI